MAEPRRMEEGVKFADAPIGAEVAITVPMHDGVGGKEIRHTVYERVVGPGRFFPARNLAAVRLRCVQGEGGHWRYDSGRISCPTELPAEQPVTVMERFDDCDHGRAVQTGDRPGWNGG